MKDIGVFEDYKLKNLFLDEYIIGNNKELTTEEFARLEELKTKLNGTDPQYESRQRCRNQFLKTGFADKHLSWFDMRDNEYMIGPYNYGTDDGSCCFFSPHFAMDLLENTPTDWLFYLTTKAEAKHGEKNGLWILFDIEHFNYGFSHGNGHGLRISLADHRDKPMMQFSSHLLEGGTKTQMIIKPTITNTTQDGIDKFDPVDRKCYIEGEHKMPNLLYEYGYRYEISNCLFDKGLRKIFDECNCQPVFASASNLTKCTGTQLHCANKIATSIGSFKKTSENKDPCLPACETQENDVRMSYASFPMKNFFFRPEFCFTASHILLVSCRNEYRRHFLEIEHKNICQILEDHGEFFNNETKCQNWPSDYLKKSDGINETLRNEVKRYGESNLASVHIFFQSPFVTRIKRDIEMTLLQYIANTGGLLGLCLGFSLISAIEVVYWLFLCLKNTLTKKSQA